MSNTILCSIDLGHPDVSKPVLKRAQQLANLDGATLSVITVVPDYGMTIVGSYFEEGTLKKAVEDSNKKLHAFVAENIEAGTKVQHIIGVGSVYEEVLKAIGEIGADLIVMGSSKPGVKELILGPNASRIARHTEASVYIVRE